MRVLIMRGRKTLKNRAQRGRPETEANDGCHQNFVGVLLSYGCEIVWGHILPHSI